MDIDFHGLFLAIFIFIVVAAILAFINWLIEGIGLYRMAKKLNIEYAWLVFLPVVKYYLIGTMVKDDSKIPHLEKILPFIQLIMSTIFGVFSAISSAINSEISSEINYYLSMLILIIPNMIFYILFFYALVLLFKKFSKDNFIIFAIIIFILPFLRSLITLLLSFQNPEIKQTEYDEYFEYSEYDILK